MKSIEVFREIREAGDYRRWWNCAMLANATTLARLRVLPEATQQVYEALNRSADPWGQCRIGAMEIACRVGISTASALAAIRQLIAVGLVIARKQAEAVRLRIPEWDESAYQEMRRFMDAQQDAADVAAIQPEGGSNQ